MTKYVIKWVSNVTLATGQGNTTFSKEEAERIADELNNSESGKILNHWAEAVTDDEQETAAE